MKTHLQQTIVLLIALVLLAACAPASSNPGPTAAATSAQTPGGDALATPPATPGDNRPLAARVNGQPIYQVDYERQVAQYQAALSAAGTDLNSQEGQDQLRQAREQILNWMIEHVLIEQAASQEGIVVTDEQVDTELAQITQDAGGEEAFRQQLDSNGMTLQDVRKELRAEMISTAAIDRITAAVPTTAEHVHARHILVETQAEADQIAAQLQAGADFGELASAYSQDESTRAAGGDLGFFPRGVLLAPEVEEAAFNLQPGQISPVIPSSFGFHIVQVMERDPAYPLSPDNLQVLRDKAVDEWLAGLWAQAVIERP